MDFLEKITNPFLSSHQQTVEPCIDVPLVIQICFQVHEYEQTKLLFASF